MWNNILDLITSKKFKVAFFSVMAVVFTALSGQIDVSEALNAITAIVMTYLGAQGIADFGKEKHKLDSPPETENKMKE